jgi:bifunctional enzyme CysN/CysC
MLPALRFITCGSVDDGKSTLIGRLLFDTRQVYADQLSQAAADSRRYGTQGDATDLALLVDGLRAEREQRITIDIAHRFCGTPRRRFVIIDAPGHEQYTRNMATGASTAHAALILVDATKGIRTQTKRHSRIVALFGVRDVILIVNKMDRVEWRADVYADLVGEYEALTKELAFASLAGIPVSALTGDNVASRSRLSPWFSGRPLVEHLEELRPTPPEPDTGFRMPVQWVNRPSADFRGVSGRIAAGAIRNGDTVRILPGARETRVKSIASIDGPKTEAAAEQSVTLILADDVDVGRGSVLVADRLPIAVDQEFAANIIWMGQEPLNLHREYVLKIHTKEVFATITRIRYRLDVDDGSHVDAETLALNDIAFVDVALVEPVAFDRYTRCPRLGAFILIDRSTNDTVAAGMVSATVPRGLLLSPERLIVTAEERAAIKGQRPRCVWLTGLSGAGKSTLALLLERRLYMAGRHTYVLDGDTIRRGLSKDLGFSVDDRTANVRRVAEVARLMVDAGLFVMVSLISPFAADRAYARGLFASHDFVEIYVDTPLDVCRRRDPKGLYAIAANADLRDLTGVQSPYEPPTEPNLRVSTAGRTPDDCVDEIISLLERD